MLDEEIHCMNCSKNIINPENIYFISTPLSKEELLSALNNLIETQNLNGIKTGVCVSCLYEYLKSIKKRLNEEEEKHENCIKALKDLLLDLSNQKEIKNVVENPLKEEEILEQDEKYRALYKRRKSLEKKIKEQKIKYKKLKEEESDILFKLNKNERQKEEKRKYKEKLIMKKQYLQKYYDKIIKQK